ncbi:eIF2A-related protein [Calothrix sp. UHCC 0171]|uniref:nSTAND1 domain-containing NTPase n=1 Tax=Calothrix sp. UHCC 0171 TaxID=3110245 RepID=UPI002B205E9C|nr:caspase family protein [Calothrix sp. UHCC 0171]MEA5571235.1 caspase family protein [Calothrix sp. UHCC 0171]
MPRAVTRNKQQKQQTTTSTLWLLLIGVNQYQDKKLPSLQYPALDCQGLSEALNIATQQFPQTEVLNYNDFTSELPTIDKVRTSIVEITTAAKPEDTILFYFSGHGILQTQQPYLCLRDTQIDDLSNTSLPLPELLQLLSHSQAHQQLVWLDACHSGGMTLRGALNPTQQIVQVLQNAAATSKGFYALLSCDSNQQSWEFPELGHGVFTYYLMQGLRGEAADNQGVITADGLYRYVYHQTLQYIDKTNQQLRLINQQRRGKGDDNLFSEYPLQTPKRIVEGIGEVILGNISPTTEITSSRIALVIDGTTNNQDTLTLSKVFRGTCGFELEYLRYADIKNLRDRIQACLQFENEAATALLYLRLRLAETPTGEFAAVIGDDIWLSRDWLRQQLRRTKVSQQVIILDCQAVEKLDIQEWIEDLQINSETGTCIIAAIAPPNAPELFVKALTETLQAASQPVGLSAAGWITQLQINLAGRLPLHVWLSGTQGVIEIIPTTTGGQSRKTPTLDLGICPYLGLKAFTEGDAQYFYGREELTQNLINHISTRSHLAIVGASGSGKSSIVQAGLISQLRLGKQLPGSEKWLMTTIRPGVHPLEVLARKLEQKNQHLILEGLLYEGVEGFVYWLRSRPEPMVMLVIDQFEELFTLTAEEERQRFLELLLGALRYAADKFKLVITLRADFIAPCLENSALANLLQTSSILIPPHLHPDDYRHVIIQPAEQVGLQVESGLVEVLLQELNHSAGDLPLLEFVLEQLWELREDGELTLLSYQQHLGGIAGALEKRAEAVYGNLDAAAQECAQWIFLSLTQLGEGTEDTRRRIFKSDLAVKKYSPAVVERTLQALTAAKLIVMNLEEEYPGIGKGTETGHITTTHSQITIEVAHEILIRHWSTLRWWLEENRSRLRSQRQIEQAASLWKQHHQQTDFLLQGVRLGEAEEIYVKYTDELSSDIQEFIAACLDERLRQANEQKQRLRQTQTALAIISVLGVTATGFGGFAYLQNRTAQIREITALNASATAFLTANQQLEGLIAGIKAGKQLQKVWAPSQDIQIATAATLQQALSQTQEINRLQAHTDKVNAVSISPDSQLIASASDDGTVKIWSRQGKLITNFKNHQDRVTSVVFSADGKFIASGSGDKTINLYTITGKLMHTFSGHKDFITSLAFSRDRRILISGSRDKTIKLWRMDGSSIRTINAHAGWVNTVAFSPDSRFMASAGEDKILKIWDIDGKLIQTFPRNQERITKIIFTPDGEKIIAASQNSKITIWNLQGNELHSFNSGQVNNINLSQDGKHLVSANTDGTIKIWNLDGSLISTYHSPNLQISDIAISNDSQIIVSSSDDKIVRIWDFPKPKKQNQAIYSLDFHPQNNEFIAAGWEGKVTTWHNNQPQNSFTAHHNIISTVKFSHDGKIIATGSADKTVKLWNAQTHQLLLTLTGHTNRITSISFSPDNHFLASASSDKTVKIWRIRDGKLMNTLSGNTDEITSLSISKDSKYIATSSADNQLKIWHFPNGNLFKTLPGHENIIAAIAFSPDNQTIASASWDNTIKIWQVSDGRLIHTLTGHSNGVTSLSFTPDSQILASGSADNTIKLWNPKDGSLIKTLTGYPSQVNTITFSSNAKTLVSGSEADGVSQWHLDLNSLIPQSCIKIQNYLQNNRDIKQNDKNICT